MQSYNAGISGFVPYSMLLYKRIDFLLLFLFRTYSHLHSPLNVLHPLLVRLMIEPGPAHSVLLFGLWTFCSLETYCSCLVGQVLLCNFTKSFKEAIADPHGYSQHYYIQSIIAATYGMCLKNLAKYMVINNSYIKTRHVCSVQLVCSIQQDSVNNTWNVLICVVYKYL